MTITPGTKLGRYEIRAKIGEGGMGEVYLAKDTELDRSVALKILPEALAANQQRLQRFIQEARAASALNHPHILTIYEVGAIGESRFIATEFVDGETLRQRMSQGMKLSEALEIAIETAGALSAAHAAGIIHRDIKPENIMVRRDGYVKVLDFGLAKLNETTTSATDPEAATRAMVNTADGMVMGTANYMSPEQAKGAHVDARTDIWSLGATLYEMVAGRVPFSGDTPTETISFILLKEPAPLTRFAPNAPGELERIVSKALTKDREERYQTIKDLLIDLRNLKRKLEVDAEIDRTVAPERLATLSTSSGQSSLATASGAMATAQASVPHSASSAEYVVSGIRQHKLAATVIALILFAGAVTLIAFILRGRKTAGAISSIAVMPFVNESGNADLEYLSDGMTETLISSLSQLPNLNVKARSSVFRYKGKETNPQTIGKELNVQAILNGRVSQRGDQLTLSLELIDAATENVIWSQRYVRQQTDLVTLQSDIARDVSSKLKSRLSGADVARVEKTYTSNPEAYQHYLKGRFYWNKRTTENLKKAIQEFQQAAEADPNYALAYVGLADSYVLLENYAGTPTSETIPQALNYATRALAIDDTLAEAHASMGYIDDRLWQWAEAEREYKRALELNPNYATAHQWYSSHLLTVGRLEEATGEIKRAQELDPLSVVINYNVAAFYILKGDVNAAVEQSKKTLELDPTFSNAHATLGLAYLKQGRNDLALAEMEKAVELSGRSRFAASIAYVYAVTGKRSEALAILKELEERYTKREAIGAEIALVYAGLGERDEAFAWLEKDFQARSGLLPNISYSVFFEPLRSDPRYRDLLRRMGLNP